MNRRRGGVGVAVLNGYMYALGGHDHPVNNPTVSRTETVERYCPQTDTWTMIASLSIGRDSIGVCVLGDRLAAVGGYDGNQYLKIFEEYDPENNEWQELAPVNFSRAGACVLNLPPIFLPSNSATVQ
jgi:kelch-like protein 1/4/5